MFVYESWFLAAVPVIIVTFDLLIVVEYLLTRGTGRYQGQDTWANIAMYWGNVATHGLYYFLGWHLFTALNGISPWQMNRSNTVHWVLLFLLDDFIFYWFHRASHRIRLLWASHVNHHSSSYFNLSTAIRQTWTPFFALPFWGLAALLGFPPVMIFTVTALSLLVQSLLHTQSVKSLGPLEWIFNTPSHHRVHHGRNSVYLDRNYAGILILWDRLFGTFAAETESVEYGIVKPLQTHHPFRIAFHDFFAMFRDIAAARGFSAKCRMVFSSPESLALSSPVRSIDFFEAQKNLTGLWSDSLSALLYYSLILLLLALFPGVIFRRENLPIAAGVLLLSLFVLLLPRLKDADAIIRRIAVTVIWAGGVLLSLHFPRGGIAAAGFAWGAVFLFYKTGSLIGEKRLVTPTDRLLFYWLFPAFRACPVSRRSGGFLVAGYCSGLLLLAAGSASYLLYPELPLSWYAGNQFQTGFWILHALKCFTLTSLSAGFLLMAENIFRNSPVAARGNFSGLWRAFTPAMFWRSFFRCYSDWSRRYLRFAGRTAATVFSLCLVASAAGWILFQAGSGLWYRASFFVLLQIPPILLTARFHRRLIRLPKPFRWFFALLTWGWVFLSSPLFFQATDEIHKNLMAIW